MHVLVSYPELLIAQIGGIIMISRMMTWRLLERFNPHVARVKEGQQKRQVVVEFAIKPVALAAASRRESHIAKESTAQADILA
jgi:hypothetical protein